MDIRTAVLPPPPVTRLAFIAYLTITVQRARQATVVVLPPSVPWFTSAQRHLGCPGCARGYRRQLAVMRIWYANAGFGPCRRFRASTTVSCN
jgi:hypothetical protein